MNLSQRLDQARAKRQAGEVPDAGPTPFDLRMAKEQPVYDGRHVRTGEPLTHEAWQRLRADDDDGSGLPTWNPKRANEEVLGAWAAEVPFDLTPPFVSPPPATPGAEGAPDASRDRDADVIDLRSRTATSASDGFSLPPWATGSPHPSVPPAAPSAPNLFAPPTPAAARPGLAPTCGECGSEAELVRLDLLTDRADLACTACAHRWTEAAADFSRPG